MTGPQYGSSVHEEYYCERLQQYQGRPLSSHAFAPQPRPSPSHTTPSPPNPQPRPSPAPIHCLRPHAFAPQPRPSPSHTTPTRPPLTHKYTANQTQDQATPTPTTSTMPVVPHNPNGVANLISSKDMEELTKRQHEGTQQQQQAAANNTNNKIPPKHYDSAGVHNQHQQLQQPRSNKQS